jgi:hypothetical protein
VSAPVVSPVDRIDVAHATPGHAQPNRDQAPSQTEP